MPPFNKLRRWTGIAVAIITFIVFFFAVERTGSLWDCGEFILGAYKLQVVHPPGAPFFLLVGRIITWFADMFSSNPSDIAFAMNLLSALCTSLTAMCVAWTTMILGNKIFQAEKTEIDYSASISLVAAGLIAGLSTAFASSIWFSAVEGEVYAMSTFCTALSLYVLVKWYDSPDNASSDRLLVFVSLLYGLSIGVHLLSLLTLPTATLLIYFKKYKKHNLLGSIVSIGVGFVMLGVVQKAVIVGIPILWKNFELMMVNQFGLPFHSGIVPTLLLLAAVTYFLLRFAKAKSNYNLHLATVSLMMVVIGFSTFGVVVVRANADTPVNMNVPSDAMRLIPYLNREQYGERPIFYGHHYNASPIEVKRTDRYGRVGDKYEITDEKYSYVYRSEDKMFFPRLGESSRKSNYNLWIGNTTGAPSMVQNLGFFFRYQLNWMYVRYFMWNFVGRQNGVQGYYPWDKSDGNWSSGLTFIDEMRLYEMDKLPTTMRENKGRNHYYFLPLIFGLIGLFYHASSKSQNLFWATMVMFLVTGLGLVFYQNALPNEPRERDYVLIGSFFTFCMWIGLSVPFLYQLISEKFKMKGYVPVIIASSVVLLAPLFMGFQNFDDHGRRHHYGARDYASNFLESCDPNAIIFTYGDNDTYPLWYAQEVEGIRTDVRVVNLSLIAVDWYINKLRSKVNDSPPIKLSIPAESYRGKKRNQVFFYNPEGLDTPKNLMNELNYVGNPRNYVNNQTIMTTTKLFIPVNKQRALQSGIINPQDTSRLVSRIEINLKKSPNYITKDDLAILDIVGSNIWERPIYFATTCKNEKLLGMNDYMQLEGLALKVVPVKTKSTASLAIYGSGRVASDKIYRNVMERFKWGNFDKKDAFIDNSYGAAIQSMRMMMVRAANDLLQRGDAQKASDLARKYFEAFPHFNFPYTTNVTPFIRVLASTGLTEDAKFHMRILGNELKEYAEFFDSIGQEEAKASFEYEYVYNYLRGIRDFFDTLSLINDTEFTNEMNTILGQYNTRTVNN